MRLPAMYGSPATDRLQTILAAAARTTTNGRRRHGPTFATVAAEWLEHGERKRGLKRSTLQFRMRKLGIVRPIAGRSVPYGA